MKEQFTSDGYKDFRQRYEGTFGYYTTETNKRLLVQVTEVNPVEMKFVDRNRGDYVALSDKGHVFEFVAPVKRLFDMRGRVALIIRKPAKQYQRGISASNTQVVLLDTGTVLAPSFNNLSCAFTDDGFNKQKFAEYVDGKREQVVLSRMIALVRDDVFLYNAIVGTVDRQTKTFKCAPMFKQEVSDCVRDLALDFNVEVINAD
jgi:hypothetical protein